MVEVSWPWSSDPQTRPPLGRCERCGGELYSEAEADGYGHIYCPECRGQLAKEEEISEIALAVLEFMDAEVKKYLSQELCDQLWNAAVRKFHLPEGA